MTAGGDWNWIETVQRSAVERALVDDTDARRYFALAGSLEGYRGETAAGESDVTPADEGERVTVSDADGLLPAAMVSLALVPFLDDAARPRTRPSLGPSGSSPTSPTTPDPWSPSDESVRPAVERGARLALRWFDVSPAQVAARADLSESALVDVDAHADE
jgi:hypothetical protein